ncbi:MAG: phospholipid-binding protein [Kamptonema sp. SIO4C4]|nr:phospholipid-binding protein [Kamptonema sp. SIO4C4]
MSWLNRMYSMAEDQVENVKSQVMEKAGGQVENIAESVGLGVETPEEPPVTEEGEEAPPERIGLNGEYDQSGLAKRVALAFDLDPDLEAIDTLWVAQLSSTVVLKGEVPSQEILDKMVDVASQIEGASEVNTDEVEVAE